DPRAYNDYISDSIYLILTQSTVSGADKVRACIARMPHIARVVAEAKKNLRRPPYVFVKTAIAQNRGAIHFFEHGIYELAGEPRQLSELRPTAKRVAEILKGYQKFLESDLLLRADGDWRIGKEKFAQKLDLELNAGLTAAEVLRMAEAEFVRVEGEMY